MFSGYLADLLDRTHRTALARADVRPDGMFEFRNIQPGEYFLAVSTIYGDPVCQQVVSVSVATGLLQVRLPEAPTNRPGAQTVSVKQLLHPPSKKAFHSFAEAQRFSASGDYARAAQALEHAVQDSPEYAEAHVNLGAQYVRTGRFADAVAELKRAIEIAGPNPVVLCNLAAAQLRLGQFAAAIGSAQAALRLDTSFPQAHLILGAILAGDERTREEAVSHLKVAAEHYDSARRILKNLGRE